MDLEKDMRTLSCKETEELEGWGRGVSLSENKGKSVGMEHRTYGTIGKP